MRWLCVARPKNSISEHRKNYKVFMSLLIRSFREDDIGKYSCVSTNSLGRAESTIRLYGKQSPVL